ncbi:beta-N-acetylhexosaminidase [Sulfobacillus sp. hq2]|uniref:beta-N-acetylhexosaminidase n=1 Tax=Sulfobacillus sp. hq2 TaxID=2039167 RepID=UPI00130483F1|nr:beta-N-acetylhexosaminidase [Sulfobacillus sp. hq2]
MIDSGLRDLIGQVLVCGFAKDMLDDHARRLIEEHHVGNIILFSRNIHHVEQVQKLTADLQDLARANGQTHPLLICTDQENGLVRRLSPDVPGLPGNMAVGASHDPALSYQIGIMTGKLLAACGINMNLAPVLDINNNPENPVIGVRSYGDNPQEVSRLGTRMIQGLQETGVIACAKHFPGHGDTQVDSHLDLPIIRHSFERMQRTELVPFEAAIDSGVRAVMTAHIVFEQLDPERPATISPTVLTGLLRERLGFEGMITTDCLEMNAIANGVGVGRGAVMALLAGADMVMISHRLDRQEEAILAIAQAVHSHELPVARLEEAVSRIAQLKATVSSSASSLDMPDDLRAAAYDLQRQSARACLTPLVDQEPHWPYPRRVAVVIDPYKPHMVAAGLDPLDRTVQTVREVLPGAVVEGVAYDHIAQELRLHEADWLLFVTAGQKVDPDMIDQLRRHGHSAVLLVHTPYKWPMFSPAKRVYALYENTPWMIQAAVRALAFQESGQGHLPVMVEAISDDVTPKELGSDD